MRPEVSVYVPTYNHRDYIEQTLDSILMQEVTFPYEIAIHDDASTDGTAEILRKYEARYPDKIRCMYRMQNQRSIGNEFATWEWMFSMCVGKYCAELEGDDYWTDPKKLQRQYDYMKAHPECTLYIHNAWRLDVRTNRKELLNTFPASGCYSQREQILCGLGSKFPATNSYFFNMECLREHFPRFAIGSGAGDYPVRQVLANQGTVYYDERPMSVYRYLTSGSFMKNIQENLDAYVNYTLQMCMFYQKFSEYLEHRFDDIYAQKIDSDILGLAAATYDHREVLPNIEETWIAEHLQNCFKLLAGDGWIAELKKKLVSDEAVWIYGTSKLGTLCKHSLEQNGLRINGFVVSNGYSKPDKFEDCEVKYLSETKGQNAFYVVAAQPINLESIKQVLHTQGECRYVCPYAMEGQA